VTIDVDTTPVAAAPERVLRGRDMLCFSHDFTGDPLSKTHLMRLLSRHNRILWVNSIGYRAPTASARDFRRAIEKVKAAAQPITEPERNIFVLSPLVVPAYGVPAMRAVNKYLLRLQVMRAMKRLGFSRPINWVFNPAAGVVAGSLGEELLLYYVVDEYTAFAGVAQQSLVDLERELLKKADLVIASADRLLQSKGPQAKRAVLVRHGVDFDVFSKALSPSTAVPAEVARLKKPVLGYFGLMASDWFEVDLMVDVAKRFPEASIVLLGKVTMDLSRLTSLPNVHLLGRKPFAELPGYAKAFDVALLPFPITEVTLNANPLKVREYLAAGLPVVSTRIPEVEVLNACAIADDSQGFCDAIERALADGAGPNAARSATMKNESWEAKLAEIDAHVASLSR
jgi:glycosyltransferase involved in cell wall biosynthesis